MYSVKSTAIVIGAMVTAATGWVIPTSCPNVPDALHPYNLAPGWYAVKVAGNMTSPRDLVLDANGRLLIVEEGIGISQHVINANGCIDSSRALVSDSELNHGICFSPDGHTLYASTPSTVYSWAYDAASGNVGGTPLTLVAGMSTSGHVTRTLVIPLDQPNLLVVSHGSNSNLDYASFDPSNGRAIVKVFDLSTVPSGGYHYATDGWNAGFGLRNEVGLAFDGNNMLWGVENSADELTRTVNGTTTDVHTDNPAEELNYLGDVTKPNDYWYGYPHCFTVWNPNSFQDRRFNTGDQFVVAPTDESNDVTCMGASRAPRMSLPAHTAPLGSKFDASYSNLFVALHGSWNRQPPSGYKLVAIPFSRDSGGAYAPVAKSNDGAGFIDVFFPPNEGDCSSSTCARPVGVVFDASQRLYMTSDASGEVFLLSAAENGSKAL